MKEYVTHLQYYVSFTLLMLIEFYGMSDISMHLQRHYLDESLGDIDIIYPISLL